MKKIVLVAACVLCGCVDNTNKTRGQAIWKQYPAYQIGNMVNGSDSNNPVFVTTIEGHHYYATLNKNWLIVGPEVPADAWKSISRRLWREEEELIQVAD